MFTRAAAVTPSTLNEGDRSVEVIFSTGARVRRADGYDDPYFEELSLDPQHDSPGSSPAPRQSLRRSG